MVNPADRLSWAKFLAERKQTDVQYFACPGATRTVMVCSHIWWTEQIGLAIRNAGFNVVMHPPLYTFYTDPVAAGQFDHLWIMTLENMRYAKVDYLLGGNTSAMLVNPKTGELLHEAARQRGQKIILINWWWDEPRSKPPLAQAGVGPADFARLLGNEHTLNAIWDIDVKEELEALLGLKNMMHLPLATLPEFWPHGFVSLEDRPLAACFLGNCHFAAEWIETDADPLFAWAREIVKRKIAAPERPMQTIMDEVTARTGRVPTSFAADSDPWHVFSGAIEVLNGAYMHYTRNLLVKAAREKLQGKLALIGKGWDMLGLRANAEHATNKSGVIYGQSHMSLNLFGGCVHGGMPLRPYDIGVSGGLIVTHDQRELPALFEPGKECLAFRAKEEMWEIMDRVQKAPAEFNKVALAGRKRVLAEHTWDHRIETLMKQLEARSS
ncbi:MAG TPA: glycosyltransferase [Phycisphaerae bacterium]